jgi:hypothetical protein
VLSWSCKHISQHPRRTGTPTRGDMKEYSDPAMPAVPMHVVHAFGRLLPIQARPFIDFLVKRGGMTER